MVRKLRVTYLLLSIFLLCSCAATGPKFTNLSSPEDGKALVYILRPPAFTASTREINISIDNKISIKLKNKGYTILNLPANTYEFKQSFSYIIGDPEIMREPRAFNIKLESGSTYFIGFHSDSAVGVPWVAGSLAFIPLTFKYGFGVMDRDTALKQLESCNFQEQKF